MIKLHNIGIALLLLLCGGLFYSNYLNEEVSFSNYQKANLSLIEYTELDILVNEGVLKNKNRIAYSYDEINSNLEKLHKTYQKLTKINQFFLIDVEEELGIINDLLTLKNNALERFKSYNSVIRNSMSSTALLINKTSSITNHQDLTEIKALYLQTLEQSNFFSINARTQTQDVNTRLDLLGKSELTRYNFFNQSLNHIKILLFNQPLLHESITEIIRASPKEQIKSISRELNQNYSRIKKQNQVLNNVVFWTAFFLMLMGVVLLFVLKGQSEKLKKFNRVLESRVLKATRDLQKNVSQLAENEALLEGQKKVLEETNVLLEQTVVQLQDSNRYKSQFLANISHELRTPLNSIILLSQIMEKNKKGIIDPGSVKNAGVISRAGLSLLKLINDILDLSKIESGDLIIDKHEFELDSLVQDITEMFLPQAEKNNIEFDVICDNNLPKEIYNDKLRLSQIITNLLSNAIKFTDEGKVVLKIDFEANESFLSISVADSGIGIPEDKQSIIFDAFKQVDGTTQRKFGGTGLGLSISLNLINQLSGSLELDSEIGKGSTFKFKIPIQLKV